MYKNIYLHIHLHILYIYIYIHIHIYIYITYLQVLHFRICRNKISLQPQPPAFIPPPPPDPLLLHGMAQALCGLPLRQGSAEPLLKLQLPKGRGIRGGRGGGGSPCLPEAQL